MICGHVSLFEKNSNPLYPSLANKIYIVLLKITQARIIAKIKLKSRCTSKARKKSMKNFSKDDVNSQ